ncbi:MAG: Thioesterase, partial [uncultured Sphingomonadaceae bacterium]
GCLRPPRAAGRAQFRGGASGERADRHGGDGRAGQPAAINHRRRVGRLVDVAERRLRAAGRALLRALRRERRRHRLSRGPRAHERRRVHARGLPADLRRRGLVHHRPAGDGGVIRGHGEPVGRLPGQRASGRTAGGARGSDAGGALHRVRPRARHGGRAAGAELHGDHPEGREAV